MSDFAAVMSVGNTTLHLVIFDAPVWQRPDESAACVPHMEFYVTDALVSLCRHEFENRQELDDIAGRLEDLAGCSVAEYLRDLHGQNAAGEAGQLLDDLRKKTESSGGTLICYTAIDTVDQQARDNLRRLSAPWVLAERTEDTLPKLWG